MREQGTITPNENDILIVTDVQYDFLPGGALAAPRCFVLEDGKKPPKHVFVNRS